MFIYIYKNKTYEPKTVLIAVFSLVTSCFGADCVIICTFIIHVITSLMLLLALLLSLNFFFVFFFHSLLLLHSRQTIHTLLLFTV